MKIINIDGLITPYHIPIIHYRIPSDIKLLLSDIGKSKSHLQYTIDGQNITLGKEFILTSKPNGTILDIKDLQGHIKGKIEFRQIVESELKPTLNFVTINTDQSSINYSTVISDLNAIYNTLNIAWQQGIHINLEFNQPYSLTLGSDISPILNVLKANHNYQSNQYYMIISPKPIGVSGYTGTPSNENWFIICNYDKRVPSHELGHCNGLDEYAVNIGDLPKEIRNKAQDYNNQYSSSNVMGYSDEALTESNMLFDFYSWQIPIILNRMITRINSGK